MYARTCFARFFGKTSTGTRRRRRNPMGIHYTRSIVATTRGVKTHSTGRVRRVRTLDTENCSHNVRISSVLDTTARFTSNVDFENRASTSLSARNVGYTPCTPRAPPLIAVFVYYVRNIIPLLLLFSVFASQAIRLFFPHYDVYIETVCKP